MPSSDYGNAVGGGLKLKGGAKDAGVKKHKRKKAKVLPEVSEGGEKQAAQELAGVANDGIDEESGEVVDDGKVARKLAAEERELGKTEAQRRHEERKRKRVCTPPAECKYSCLVCYGRSLTCVSACPARRTPAT